MSLFMNMIDHPEVFMNTEEIPTANQQYYKYDSFFEIIQSQQKVNNSLQKSFQLLDSMHHQQQHMQSNRWNEITDQLAALDKNDRDRTEFDREVMNRLNELNDQRAGVEKIIAEQHQLREQSTAEVNTLIQTHEQFVIAELEKHRTSTEKLSTQLDELHVLQQTISETVNDQMKEQSDMNERLANQEALMEKISRQLIHYRSILYERTNDLTEKIEESYKITSTYLYKLITGSAEPFSVFMTNQKKTKANQKEDQYDDTNCVSSF